MNAFTRRGGEPIASTDPALRADLGRLLPAPGDPELPRDRHLLLKEHLLREIQSSELADVPATAPVTAAAATGPRRPGRRFALSAGALTAAGAVAAAIVVGGQAAPAPSGGVSATGHQQAVTLLGQIAAAADTKPIATVRGDQFVYIDSKVTTEPSGPLHDRKVWLSVDGTRAGLLQEPPTLSNASLGTNPEPNVNAPTYDYLAGLPTDPAKLLDLIYTQTKNEGKSRGQDAEAFTTIGDLLRESMAPPQLTAALYRAAALIPGVVEVPDAVDATGRHGVAVAEVDASSGIRSTWIFDKKSLDYLGETEVQGSAGTVLFESAVLSRAIVDKAGQTH